MQNQPLAVVPTYIRNEGDLRLLTSLLTSLERTAPGTPAVVVDDASPRQDLVGALRQDLLRIGHQFVGNRTNVGFSATANVGLRMAQAEGRDALLVNADVEFVEPGWLEALYEADVYVAGGKLLFPNGLLQHGGIYYSVLHRQFDHIYRYSPEALPESDVPRVCPVTGALMLIRNECLSLVGLLDEEFGFGYEDVDYCIRVFKAGRSCAYVPGARAIHREGYFSRGSVEANDRSVEGLKYLHMKHMGTSFAEFTPTMLEG